MGARSARTLARLALVLGVLLSSACSGCRDEATTVEPETPKPPPHGLDRGDNGLWARRQWIHGERDDVEALARDLRARGIRRYYPFLGPPDASGVPGWRKDEVVQRWDPDTARRFFAAMRRHAPEVTMLPWTGGVLGRDIHFDEGERLQAWAKQLGEVVRAGAHGVQINVEPMPSGANAYLELLDLVRAEIGPDAVLGIAAYPPETPLHPFPSVHWSYPFIQEVCRRADEMAFMAYDTALTDGEAYRTLVAEWTTGLADALALGDDGCDWLIGVPTYEDEGVAYHHPEAETLENGLQGAIEGLRSLESVPRRFRGVALYASWTTDAAEWETYDRTWREREPAGGVAPDGPTAP